MSFKDTLPPSLCNSLRSAIQATIKVGRTESPRSVILQCCWWVPCFHLKRTPKVVIGVADSSGIQTRLKSRHSASGSLLAVTGSALVLTSAEVGMMATWPIVPGPGLCSLG